MVGDVGWEDSSRISKFGFWAMSGGYTRPVAWEERKVETEDGTHTSDCALSASSSCRRSCITREDRGASEVPSL
jgi:hypothetical protein